MSRHFSGSLAIMFSACVMSVFLPSTASGSDGHSDPTRPPAALDHSIQSQAAKTNNKLDLRAIFFSEGRRIAIINDQRLRENDVLENARVISIQPGHVVLRRKGKNIELRLISRKVKTDPTALAEKSPLSMNPIGLEASTGTTDALPPASSGMAIESQVEDWGGPATLAIEENSHDYEDSATDPIDMDGAGERADWNEEVEAPSHETSNLSSDQTPSWLPAFIGEGKER